MYEFHRHIIFNFPEQTRARNYMGRQYYNRRMVFHALAVAGDGLSIDPTNCLYNLQIGKYLATLGFFPEARIHLDNAERYMIEPQRHNLMEQINGLRQKIVEEEARRKAGEQKPPEKPAEKPPEKPLDK